MGLLNRDFIQLLLKYQINNDLFLGEFAIEKENVRVDSSGNLARTPHPKAFGKKMENPYIKTDFAESQIEMITPVFDTINKTYNFLNTLHDIVALELKEEYLWPGSNPPLLPDEDEIPVADMGDPIENKYRWELVNKYGRVKQLYSGIHYNFSFPQKFLRKWYEAESTEQSFKEFKDATYLKVVRNTLKYRWLLIYLTGASPAFHQTFLEECVQQAEETAQDSFLIDDMISLRNSEFGYRNINPFFISFDSLEEYLRDIKALIEAGELLNAKEYYSAVRLKPADSGDYFASLRENGIAYLELRLLDLNPLEPVGISQETMRFIHLFLIYMLVKKDEPYDQEEHILASYQSDILNRNGHLDSFIAPDGTKIRPQEKALELLKDMEEMLLLLNPGAEEYLQVLEINRERIRNKNLLIASQIKKKINDSSFIQFHLGKAREYLLKSMEHGYQFKGYEDLELSTQLLLKAAIKRGIEFNILDRDENFIVLKKGMNTEYVKQATKTSLDSYITALIMENKLVTKHVLEQQGIRVPNGRSYRNISEAIADYELYQNKPIVIKPKSTNFGIGITIFTDTFTKGDFQLAVQMAFEHDKTILLEEFISGKEYRFLVMGDEVVGILHRVPANVIGDGQHTIAQLAEDKNKDPLRGKGYRTPLEKIQLGEAEKLFLKNQGKGFMDVPEKGEVVYLRENSNISTGGDSLDYTDEIPDSYKKIAVSAAKAAGAVFCGVDMMIEDMKNEASEINYGIIEINFNPAIHIHCYPYKGKNRHADEKILDLLFQKSKQHVNSEN
ncbi:bifunctional glutamate--cysteine ligase GshA/glutathione synthetase GshB [Bacillus benzoevorans]|uniref:Glutathione biosynthesis bifunctional protein GshAB n=1 Tax=Bacillus benzoevorans TaxID=1456 RepID=A0A7X0HT38_9BACI|nr:bifunctional glutamate--cysteine ligase GshA/glutathione synthetase GshB [Bacillus benzoevorans]MBB6445250.1 glutamate--cysteine ligase [Bacillus benzoevorans]